MTCQEYTSLPERLFVRNDNVFFKHRGLVGAKRGEVKLSGKFRKEVLKEEPRDSKLRMNF